MVHLSGKEVGSDDELRALYQERLKELSYSAQLMFYKSREQHERKLRTIALAIRDLEKHERICSILDIGCGYGQLLQHYTPRCSYTGIDLVPEFVQEAKRRYPGQAFLLKNALEDEVSRADVCILAGVLSGVPNPRRLLLKALNAARRAVVFDITIEGRVPADFRDLNRWSVDEVAALINQESFELASTIDLGSSWVLFSAERRPG